MTTYDCAASTSVPLRYHITSLFLLLSERVASTLVNYVHVITHEHSSKSTPFFGFKDTQATISGLLVFCARSQIFEHIFPSRKRRASTNIFLPTLAIGTALPCQLVHPKSPVPTSFLLLHPQSKRAPDDLCGSQSSRPFLPPRSTAHTSIFFPSCVRCFSARGSTAVLNFEYDSRLAPS